MSILKDAAEAIKGVSESIEHIRRVAKAVQDGREYLKLKHPEVRTDLSAMCAEMRNTLTAIAAASAILTHFRFTVTGSAVDSEPRAFNDHLIAHKEKAERVTQSLHAMRGHCHVIKQHSGRLQARAESLNLDRLLRLFGIDSAERDREVAEALRDIHDEETQAYRVASQLSRALQFALSEINKTLGPPGTMHAGNVPAAAALLGEYAEQFSKLESMSNYVALELQQSIDVLEGRI